MGARILVGSFAAGLAASLTGCAPYGDYGYGYGVTAPVYGDAWYGAYWPIYGGFYYGGRDYAYPGYVWRGAYYPYRRGLYWRGGYDTGYDRGGWPGDRGGVYRSSGDRTGG